MAIKLWIPMVEIAAVLAVTCILLRKYADLERTNWFSLIITGISWFLAFSIICFIPLDIYSVSNNSLVFMLNYGHSANCSFFFSSADFND